MKNVFEDKYFAKKWDEHSKKDVLRTRSMNTILAANIGNLKGKSVLDAGCGNGFFLPDLLRKKPRKLCAGDKSRYLLEIAKKKFPMVSFRLFDLNKKLPYGKNFFDVVVCYTVLLQLSSIDSAIKEIVRATKKNGTVHIVTIHPLYALFFANMNAKKETTSQKLTQYLKEKTYKADTLAGLVDNHRPIGSYVNAFGKYALFIEKMLEIPVPNFLAKTRKYKNRIGCPLFLYFKLKKRQQTDQLFVQKGL